MIPVGILTAAATSSFSFLLDTYSSASIAYSLRKLKSTYVGNAIRVRRSIDNTETNIGFVSNVLDTASLLTFCGVGDGFVTTWYDQSGTGNNSIQTVAFRQPKIVNLGSLYIQNGYPTIYFNQINQQALEFTAINSDTNTSAYLVGKALFINQPGPCIGHNADSGTFIGQYLDASYRINSLLNGVSNNSATAANTADLSFCIQNAYITTIYTYYKNNTLIPITNFGAWSPANTTFQNIGTYGYVIFSSNAYISEVILYKTNQLSNRTGINGNINTFYTIF